MRRTGCRLGEHINQNIRVERAINTIIPVGESRGDWRKDDVNAVESEDELRRPRDETAYAPVAQWIERRFSKPWAVGSNPTGGARLFGAVSWRFQFSADPPSRGNGLPGRRGDPCIA